MSGDRVVLTYKEYEAVPADGRRYELHEGELSVAPAPSPQHQRISRRLAERLGPHVAGHAAGEVLYAPIDVILSETTVVQPDLVYLDPSRAQLVSDRGIEGPPSLVIEILSPSTALVDRTTKRQLYGRHGIPWYWIVDPEDRAIEVYRLDEGAYHLALRASGPSPVALPPFPDLPIAPASLWS